MARIVKIGNSQGIRIPKSLVEQAQLEGKELKIQLVNEGLLISPEKVSRQHWKEEIAQIIATQGSELIDSQWLDVPLDDDDNLDW